MLQLFHEDDNDIVEATGCFGGEREGWPLLSADVGSVGKHSSQGRTRQRRRAGY